MPINPHPAAAHHREVFGFFFFTPHINKYSYILMSSHRSLRLSSYVRYTSPLTISAALYCTLSISFLPCRTPELDTTLQMCPTPVDQRGKIIFFSICWQFFFLILSKAVVCHSSIVQTHVQIVAYQNSGSFCTRLFSSCFAPGCTDALGFSSSGKGLLFSFVEFHEIPIEMPPNSSITIWSINFLPSFMLSAELLKVQSVPSSRPLMKVLNSFVSQN